MPLQVIRGSLRVLSKSLPSNLQKIDFEQLQLGCDCANKYFQGTVVASYPLNRLGNGTTFFKIVLQESENSDSGTKTISTLVFGKLAEECAEVIHQEDVVVVAGFSLSKSSSEDDRHCCQLEMSDEAGSTLYIWTRSPRTMSASAALSMPVAPKYTYTPLNELQGGTVVNVYGVVKFFKPPFVCKGKDYCSVVTIVDQSNTKLLCTFFHLNRDALPQIYKTGDIARFHRIKIVKYHYQLQGRNRSGFASLTFDGTVGAPVVPRTSSKLFTFTDEDKKTVEDLRTWESTNLINSPPAATLCDIQPPMYFELICQLIGKAKVDGSSYLLKVWDGTKCPFPSWKVLVKDDDLEGDHILIRQLKNLTVDVIVYDNHVHLARSLKVGSFIRMYNLHAKFQSPEGKPDVSYIQFHLHSGTCYGRGIAVLTESETDAKALKQFLDSVDLSEDDYSEASPEFEDNTYIILGSSLERCQQLSVTVLTDLQHFDVTALNTVINSRTPQPYRIRAKLRKYEPEKLHQSVKLHCPQCNLLQEIPDEAEIGSVIREASAVCSNSDLQSTTFCESGVWDRENQGQQHVAVHFVKHNDLLQQPEDSLVMIEGGTLREILKLTKKFKGVITVRSTEDDLVLLDLSAPYLWQGNMQYYGCKYCSDPKAMINLSSLAEQEDPSWEATTIAEALGVVPLEYVFVMKFTLDDGTGSLDVYLKDSKDFFQIPASEVLINNIFQENMERIMNKLCPSGKDLGDLPWLECIVKSYYVSNGTEEQIYYQIFDTTIAEDV